MCVARSRTVAALWILCTVLAAIAAGAQTSQQTALVLIGTRRDAPVSAVLDTTIRTVLIDGLGDSLDYHTEYLDVARFPDPEYQGAVGDFLARKYAGLAFDVIVAMSDATADFAFAYRDRFSPGAAVVFDVTSPRLAPHSTGVVTPLDLRKTVDVALHVHPDLRHVFVVSGASDEDRAYADAARAQLRSYEGRLGVTYSSAMALSAVLQQVAALPPQTIVFFLTFFEDARGSRFISFDVFKQVASVANAPLYHWTDTGMGHGMVGGSVRNNELRAHAAALTALRVLKGESPDRIPVRELDTATTEFDWRQLQSWGISETQLPPGSIVRFREPSLWDQYRFYVIGAAGVIVLQTALIGGLLVQGVRRRRAEAELRDGEAALRTSHARNQDLVGRLIHAQELERARIARELHDDVGQRVASLSIGLGSVKRRFADAPQPARDELASLQRETVALGDDLRLLSHELHPALLEHLGLVEALRARGEKVSAESGVAVAIDVASELDDVPDDVGLCFYRVAQEALRNVVNHARARSVRVALTRAHGRLAMRIADDGRGFDATPAGGQRGLGLVSLDERVRMLGGTLVIESAAGQGTTVSVSVPVGDVP